MKLTWCTDVHLDFVSETGREAFYAQLKAIKSDAVVVTGDLGEAHTTPTYLKELAEHLGRPVYYVLGNHDYYDAVGAYRSPTEIRLGLPKQQNLHYLSAAAGPITIADRVALVGVDGWYDGRYGMVDRDKVWLADFEYVPQLRRRSPPETMRQAARWADEWAVILDRYLRHAWVDHDTIFVATHVPPYREASTYKGQPSGEHYAPFFVSKATGDTLDSWAKECPDRMFVVLCGHTHGASVYSRRDNLVVWTGGAQYRRPRVGATLDTGDWEVGMPRVRAKQDICGDWTDDFVPAGTPGIVVREDLSAGPDLHVLFANGVHFATLNNDDVETYTEEW